jgi:glutaminyl-tRNA synthetase
VPVELRLYDRLFTQADMSELAPGKTYKDYLNPACWKQTQSVLPKAAWLRPILEIGFSS